MESSGPDTKLGVKWFTLVDWPLLILVLSLTGIGILFIYSATFSSESEYLRSLYLKQLEWTFYAVIVMVVFALIDYRMLERPAYIFYFVMLLLLLKVLISAKVISGSGRWIGIMGFNVQPSELMKVVLVITLARYFDDSRNKREWGFRELLPPAVITLIPAAMIAKQPDLGTGVVIFFIFGVMAFVNGIRRRTLAIIGGAAVVLVPLFWFSLKDYQKNRILALLDPSSDPLGIGYHTIQSKIAIGSGGLFGKGLFAGTQSKLNFLPEKHTDFIFSVFAEEVGFIWAVLLIVLYFVLLLRIMDIVLKSRDRPGSVMAAGAAAILGFHFFYNVAMTLGLVPIVGIPLPFFSYGGSALVSNYALIGILLSISIRRFRHD